MDIKRQEQAPFVEALEAYCRLGMTPFHTPGHKGGRSSSPYQRGLFGDALRRDLGLMYALDDLFQPEGPLKEAMELAADLYGAGRTFFSVNGTTACIEAMILAVCRRGDYIIIPREAHRSVMGGLILSGAIPVYMESRFAETEQISLGPDLKSLQAAIAACPQAKAVLFTYPTYDGIAGNLEEMARYAHKQGMFVLVDEAHGAHLPFCGDLPKDALSCGADCTAQSTHKLTGSLTQTSMLHCRRGFPLTDKVAAAMALVQSTSPHYWFLASLDSARRQLAFHGTELVGQAVGLARQVRSELNGIDGLYSFGTEITAYDAVGAFDETKVTIDFSGLGMDGRQAEKLLRQEGVEAELTAGNHVLALITMGDDEESARTLCRACRRVAEGQAGRTAGTSHRMAELPLPVPRVVVPPQEAWNAETEAVPFAESLGRVAAETVTFYPPGIPAVGLGEEITDDVMIYIEEKLARGYSPNGPADGILGTIRVIKEG